MLPFKTAEQQREYDKRRYALNINGRKDYKKAYNKKPKERERARIYAKQLRDGPRRQEILEKKKVSYRLNKDKPKPLEQMVNKMFNNVKTSAKKRNHEFNLTKEFIRNLFETRTICPVFNSI